MSAQAIVAQILTSEPRSLAAQRKNVPENVDAAVMTALEKLPADRFATATQFAEALDGKSAANAVRRRSAARGGGDARMSHATIALVAALVLATALAAWGWLRSAAASQQVATSLAVTVPADVSLAGIADDINISADGRRVVFTGQAVGGRMLYVRDLGAATVRALPNTEGVGCL